MSATILWVDDEIDHLGGHIRFLEKKGYRVLTAGSGARALEVLRENRVDLVLMDQMMVGMDGLETVEKIRDSYHSLPVVMVTQSEEEELMDRALGGVAEDFLTKPVNPSQILLVLKRILSSDRLRREHATGEVVSQAGRLAQRPDSKLSWRDWVDFYHRWMEVEVFSGSLVEREVRKVHRMRLDDLALGFSRFVERRYPRWITGEGDPPPMPQTFLRDFVVPELESTSGEVVLLVMDCMRLDQWLAIYSTIEGLFHQELSHMFVNMPSATPYSRNALFAGLLPRDIWRFYRGNWREELGTPNLNRHEPEHMRDALRRHGWQAADRAEYVKVRSGRDGEKLHRNLSHRLEGGFLAVVVSFLDHLTHGRSESDLLKDLAPDVVSFRNLARSWFVRSHIRSILETLAARGATVVVTSDHGSKLSRRATHIRGGRGMSSSVRFRMGHSLTADARDAVVIRQPAEWGLPDDSPRKSYVLARSDYLLIHPAMDRSEMHKFENTFQHGGCSLQEMVVPVAVLRPKRLG
jgi:CheY-like chemotaxis protein